MSAIHPHQDEFIVDVSTCRKFCTTATSCHSLHTLTVLLATNMHICTHLSAAWRNSIIVSDKTLTVTLFHSHSAVPFPWYLCASRPSCKTWKTQLCKSFKQHGLNSSFWPQNCHPKKELLGDDHCLENCGNPLSPHSEKCLRKLSSEFEVNCWNVAREENVNCMCFHKSGVYRLGYTKHSFVRKEGGGSCVGYTTCCLPSLSNILQRLCHTHLCFMQKEGTH